MATSQAKDAIRRLLQSGWNRSQFSVRTERRYAGKHPETGHSMYEYGDVHISLKNSTKEEQLAKAKAMADNGFHVSIFEFVDGRKGYPKVYTTSRLFKRGVWIICQKESL